MRLLACLALPLCSGLGSESFWEGVLDDSACLHQPLASAELLSAAAKAADVFEPQLRRKVLGALTSGRASCGLARFLAQLVLVIADAESPGADGDLERYLSRIQLPLPSFFRVASSFLPEVLALASVTLERRLSGKDRYESCKDAEDLGEELAINSAEKSAGVTFWTKAMALAEKIVREQGFEWTNEARVAFSASLIGKKARRICPSGVMALKLIRCIGHDETQKQEEVYGLAQEAEELLGWGLKDVSLPKLFYNAWPFWGLLALLASTRHHSFQVSPRSLDLSEAPLLATLQAAPLAAELRGAAVVAAVDRTMAAQELAVWVSRLRRSLLPSQQLLQAEHHVVLVMEPTQQDHACGRLAWFGHAGRLLSCVQSAPDASLELDAQALGLWLLSRQLPVALLSTATIPFPGLGPSTPRPHASGLLGGDQLAELLARNRNFAMFLSDTQVAVGPANRPLVVQAPFMDVGLRLLRPVMPTMELLRWSVRLAYGNPFLRAAEVLNRFNISEDLDFVLGASHGFVSSEGWRAEDLRAVSRTNETDPHFSGGILLFTMRPFHIMRRWFSGHACRHVCAEGLLKCPAAAAGSACNLLSEDRLLLETLKDTFLLREPSARSARVRLLQAGPSSCGTTSIAHFFADGHGLRVAKNYVEGMEIRDLVNLALSEGRAPFSRMDHFDVVADAFDVVRVGVHFCSDGLGHGGQSCKHNTCNLQSWLSKRVHNCWPHLAAPGEHWSAWLQIWESCCNPVFGYGGNLSCWTGDSALDLSLQPYGAQKVVIPGRLNFQDFAYPTCCEGLPFYQEAWRQVHRLLLKVVDSSRRVPFNIAWDDPLRLSQALGLQDSFQAAAWRKIHQTRKSATKKT
ncbi:unnamed protein product [Effrenium voratum]|nr:unnamed protein product [Effrenium voratum]